MALCAVAESVIAWNAVVSRVLLLQVSGVLVMQILLLRVLLRSVLLLSMMLQWPLLLLFGLCYFVLELLGLLWLLSPRMLLLHELLMCVLQFRVLLL